MRHEGKLEALTLNLVMVGALGWIAWKVLGPMLGSVKAGADAVGGAIGKAYAWWMMPAPLSVNGKYVVQPSGQLLEPNQFQVNWIDSLDPRAANYNGQLPTIRFAGLTYVLGPRDERGNYPAVRL